MRKMFSTVARNRISRISAPSSSCTSRSIASRCVSPSSTLPPTRRWNPSGFSSVGGLRLTAWAVESSFGAISIALTRMYERSTDAIAALCQTTADGWMAHVGVRNYLVEGVSGTGKTSVCQELRRRGYHAINGDRELAYQGDPATGEPTDTASHHHHIWDVDRVRALAADDQQPVTFFCGGSRNWSKFVDLFDEVFVLDIDLGTLLRRLDERPPDEFGSKPSERDLVLRLHRTRQDIPATGARIDAAKPLTEVVDEILRCVER